MIEHLLSDVEREVLNQVKKHVLSPEMIQFNLGFRIGTPSYVLPALKALVKKHFIEKKEGRYFPVNRGCMISLEGGEGSGKTTIARMLSSYLSEQGYQVRLTREPGGCDIGMQIREILLRKENTALAPMTELLLFNAARAQHLHEKILPALKNGQVIICDRFSDSTFCYQGARGISTALISMLDSLATRGFRPDLTILCDIDPELGMRRNRQATKDDRFEQEELAFHRSVRERFLIRAEIESSRMCVIDASLPIDAVFRTVTELVDGLLQSSQKEDLPR